MGLGRVGRGRILVAATAWGTAAVLAAGPMMLGPAVADSARPREPPVTVSGTGPFSSLKVSVSQTSGLIDQVVKVSWTGGTLTQTNFAADYLQIMECWSADAAGPTREQCEYGNSQDTRGGAQVTSRQLDAGASYKDPLETQQATTANPYNYVPFEAVGLVDDPANPGHLIHQTVPGDRESLGKYFDPQSTKRLPLNSTGADGSGEAYFETMTAEEASGLGCGATATDADGQPFTPHCWMVVVPRGETEVNGAASSATGSGLQTTPLSATNWADRIVIPLQFNPIALSCPIGSPEQQTSGQEAGADAVFSWQAALCKQSGTVFSYSEVSDDSARRQLLSHTPGLDFFTNPVPATNPASAGVVYAPVAVSGAVIAFNIDYTMYGSTALRPLAGQRVPAINLTPRLVAKLLTQSYRSAAPGFDPFISSNVHNVLGLTYDPDFFSVNPSLTDLDTSVGDVLMPFAPSDAIQQLWRWVDADPAARAFLDGAPDPWGMTVNPNYAKLTDTTIPTSFPKLDPYCQPRDKDATGSQPANLCTLDDRPYANDMHDAARSAARGDTLSRALWDPTPPQPHYKKVPLQLSGSASVMAFTDAATANLYSLPVARLENSSGEFVGPTAAGLSAGLASMTPSAVPGVLQADPESSNPAAYPLTSVVYAATAPAALTADARSNYADFLQYVATGGQVPGVGLGQLPYGYLPLTQPLVTQALTTSVALRSWVAPTPTSSPPPQTTSPAATRKPSPKPSKTPVVKPPSKTPSVAPTTRVSTPATTFVSPPSPVPPVPVAPTLPVATPAGATSAPATTAAPPVPATTSPAVAAIASPGPRSAPPASAPTKTIAEVTRTPAVAAPGTRYAVIVVLAIGGLCALSGPTLLRFGGRRPK